MKCLVCAQRDASQESLCEPCASRLRGNHALCPEQIHCLVEDPAENAGLVDEWGRVHPLLSATPVRRRAVAGAIAIAEPSVSRTHAEVRRLPGGGWEVRDMGSSNGTAVNGTGIVASAVRHGDVIQFGHIGFFFVTDLPVRIHPRRSLTPLTTMKPTAPSASAPAEGSPVTIYDEEVIEETFCGLRPANMRIATPTGGGGGVLEIDGQSVQLTLVQLELFQVLARRMLDEVGRDERVRGFVRSSELLATLAWDTPKPEDNHMKQLVRRVRRALARAGIPEVIESRHGFGYRLSVLPRRPPDAAP